MDLNILVSKKGTKVVVATELHQALQLADHHYAVNIKRWLNDWYDFSDGIRKPIKLQEFADRKTENPLIQDYYLSVALAKQIVLRSRSKVKQKYALQLATLQEDETTDGLNPAQFQHLVELTQAMTLISCQEECERRHLRMYKERNGGSAANWWQYRAEVLGYTTDSLRDKLRRKGQPDNGSQRELLSQLSPLELIRAGIIDLFMAIGKSKEYAIRMGDLSKQLAASLHLSIIDDQRQVDLFTHAVDPELVHRLKEPLSRQLVAA
ncbi:MAG: hypothetical protein R2795_03385 [Saprospiraceae bacterium]